MMAMKKAGLPDSFPILVFSTSPYSDLQMSVAGFCAGHHFAGVIGSSGLNCSVGHGSIAPLIDYNAAKS